MTRAAVAALCLVLLASAASGAEWKIVGTRAQGMGGAFVAVADDSTAAYWNPAGYARFKGFELRLDAGVALESDPEMLKRAEDVFDTIDQMEQTAGQSFDQIMADIDAGTATSADIQQALYLVAEGFRLLDDVDFGAVASAYVTTTVGFGRLGVSVNGMAAVEAMASVNLDASQISLSTGGTADANVSNVFTDAFGDTLPEVGIQDQIQAIFSGAGVSSADARADNMVDQAAAGGLDVNDPAVQQTLIDMANALVNTSGTQGLVLDNSTSITVSGALTTEAVVTYGHPFADGALCLGVNVKGIQGETYRTVIPYDQFEQADEIIDDMLDRKNREVTTAIGLDVGILWAPVEMLSVGLVARNVNSPEFDFKGGGTYELEPQARLGVAVRPFKCWVVAADIDVTENVVEGADSLDTRFLAVGTEFRFWKIMALRAGANLNLADPGLNELYTAGLGIGAGGAFRLDVSAALAGDRDDLDFNYDLAGFDLPAGVGVSVGLQISTRF